jgi:hypothetical protein
LIEFEKVEDHGREWSILDCGFEESRGAAAYFSQWRKPLETSMDCAKPRRGDIGDARQKLTRLERRRRYCDAEGTGYNLSMSKRRIPRWVWRTSFMVGVTSFIMVVSIISGDLDGIFSLATAFALAAISGIYRYLTAKPAEPLSPALIAWLDEKSRATREIPAAVATIRSDYD